MKCLKLTTALVATLLASVPARAEMKVVTKAGDWMASAGINDDGEPMCGLRSKTIGGAQAQIKWTFSSGLFFHVAKWGWKIPANTKVPMAVWFNTRPNAYKGTGVAKGTTGRDVLMPFVANEEQQKDFLGLLASAATIHFKFSSGNEGDWTVPLKGGDTVAPIFAKCIRTLQDTATQPFSKDSEAQPDRS